LDRFVLLVFATQLSFYLVVVRSGHFFTVFSKTRCLCPKTPISMCNELTAPPLGPVPRVVPSLIVGWEEKRIPWIGRLVCSVAGPPPRPGSTPLLPPPSAVPIGKSFPSRFRSTQLPFSPLVQVNSASPPTPAPPWSTPPPVARAVDVKICPTGRVEESVAFLGLRATNWWPGRPVRVRCCRTSGGSASTPCSSSRRRFTPGVPHLNGGAFLETPPFPWRPQFPPAVQRGPHLNIEWWRAPASLGGGATRTPRFGGRCGAEPARLKPHHRQPQAAGRLVGSPSWPSDTLLSILPHN